MSRAALCLAVVVLVSTAAIGDETQDFVYLGTKPIFLRFHLKVDGREVQTPFAGWLRQVFDRCDADHDGLLDAAEQMKLPAAEKFRSAESIPKIRGMWKPDVNSDGKVAFEELVAAVEAGVGPALSVRMTSDQTTPEPQYGNSTDAGNAEVIFKQLDVDHDQQLSAGEIQDALAVLRKLDRDDDDSFSQQELVSINPYGQFRQSRTQNGWVMVRNTPPFLHLKAGQVSTKSVRQLFNQYDKQSTDLQLTQSEFPLGEGQFLAYDANKDSHLDFDEVLLLLQQATPQIECTFHVPDKWERNPAIQVECHDASLKEGIRTSPSGEVTLNLGSAQIELSLPAAGTSTLR